MLKLLGVYLITINLIAIIITAWDKHAAKASIRRVPEATLLWIAFFGGSAAMLGTMKLIRHKTRKAKFMVGIPLIMVLQVLAIGAFLLWQTRSLFIG